MDSRFAHLRQRDSSVSMLRVKLSRRRSQSQKENRDRALNTRRQLDKLQELESSSLDVSTMATNMSTIHEKTQNAKPAKNEAVEERIKQLERWKERKALEKEKEKREKERKGVFKTGLYHPKGMFTVASLPPVSAVSTRAKEAKLNTTVTQSTRVTRSMKQQQAQKDRERNTAVEKAERSTRSRAASKPVLAPSTTRTKVCPVVPVVRGLSTRSANRPPVTAVPAVKEKPADAKTTRTRGSNKPGAPSSGRDRDCKVTANSTVQPEEPELQEPEQKVCPSSPRPCADEKETEKAVEVEKEEQDEEMAVDQPPADSTPTAEGCSSFAPQGFVFQAPTGLSSFKFEPLTPRSADAFLTPSSSFNLSLPPTLDLESEQSDPSLVLPTPASPQEPKHDVPYFRSEISSETDRLTSLCGDWEAKVEDESIPEEMRDRMRTAIGQARLLMKERFNQFSGLVDDCELGRGEKITTCTDLQGFWDMVYYQVEDVYKKFDALKEAEARGWEEEHKPAPRQRKAVKKAPAAAAKPAGTKPAGTNAAAKSRLAAAKAAMKAKQQAVKASKAAGDAEDEASRSSQETRAQPADVVVFDGGFFKVESPTKPTGSVRRSSRLSAAVVPQASPCSKYLTPRRLTRGSTAPSPAQTAHTPARLGLGLAQSPGPAPKSQPGTPQPTRSAKAAVNVSLCFTPVTEVPSDGARSEGRPVPLLIPTPVEDADTRPVSPRLTLPPCEPPPTCQEPESSSVLPTLTLSPCSAPSPPPLSSLAAISSPLPLLDHAEARMSTGPSPDSSVVENVPGLDFERYLQPSQRCSLSPRVTVTMETLSPAALDVEMESPRAQGGDLPTQDEAALPAVSTALTPQSPQVQTAASALLLFTPDLKNRIRQSVCPSDLMVFTPPSDMQ